MAKKTLPTQTYQFRDFNGLTIRQRRADEFIDATQLLSIYNSIADTPKDMADFFRGDRTARFLIAVAKEAFDIEDYNVPNLGDYKTDAQIKKLAKDLGLLTASRGKGGATFVHPYLFVGFAMWLSPEFNAKVCRWVSDNLIGLRRDTASQFKPMCEALEEHVVDFQDVTDNKEKGRLFAKYTKEMNEILFGFHSTGMRIYMNSDQLSYLGHAEHIVVNACKRGRVVDRGTFIGCVELIADPTKFAFTEDQLKLVHPELDLS